MAKVLLIDDEMTMLQMVGEVLRSDGHQVIPFTNAIAARDRLSSVAPDLILAHLALDRTRAAGDALLQKARSFNPPALVMMILPSGPLEVAVETMKRGAYDYINKPFTLDELKLRVQRALSHRAALAENLELRKQSQPEGHCPEIVGRSPRLQEAAKRLAEAADSESPVLLSGDPGCGKELFARTIHLKSRRRFAPFIALSCRTPSEQLLERELFGDPKGSAYGVVQANTGVFKRAEGGTILLKECECLPSALQSRIADMLERRAIVDPGEAAPISVDIRVIAASSPALEQRAAEAAFSRELYQRLSETRIVVPRLRDRAEDIPLLVAHFLNGKIHARSSKPYVLRAEALELCCAYTWPGNVLELEMALEQACMVCQDGNINRGDFPRAVQELSPPPLSNAPGHLNSRTCVAAVPNLPCGQLEAAVSNTRGYAPPADEALVPLKKFLRDQEVTYLQRTLAHVGGSKERAAELLGISLATIYRKLSEPETVSGVL